MKSRDGKRVLYVGAFVTNQMEVRAAARVSTQLPDELLSKLHHMTFAFKPDWEWCNKFFMTYPAGKEFTARADRLFFAPTDMGAGMVGGIAALTVCNIQGVTPAILDEVVSKTPHITAGVTKGVPPSLSGALIRGERHVDIVSSARKVEDVFGLPLGQIDIHLRVGWFDGGRVRFDNPI